jgi:UDPglucose 6-dehydrogenase
MPEFLTARRAYEDMCRLPIVIGKMDHYLIDQIFPDKEKLFFTNKECELAKFTHNCFGAFKVTYFNIINKLCEKERANFFNVKHAANITGFLGNEHTQVPGPDQKFGYGGTCFGPNMKALQGYLETIDLEDESEIIKSIRNINLEYRGSEL